MVIMARLLLPLLATLLLATPAAAQTAPAPVPVEEWPLERITALGREIYEHDRAAWVATDALLPKLSQDDLATVRGWIVVPADSGYLVRFIRADGDSVQSGWDIPVRDGRAGEVTTAATSLTDEEQTRVAARNTAAANIGRLQCSDRMNSVVTRDPDGDGWLVWLLTSTTNADVIPMGGHYRFHISADGQTVQRRDMLTNSCLNMPRPTGEGGQSEALVISQIVSQTPVETHVFLSLQQRLPIYVMAGDIIYAVQGDRIRTV